MTDVIKGVTGLVKAVTKIERANKITIDKRLEICDNCPNKMYAFSSIVNKNVPKCKICGCYIKAKVLLKNEFCPDPNNKRWDVQK